MNKLSYDDWSKAVDEILFDTIGLDQGSLPDWLSRDAWQEGMTPGQGATECLSQARFDEYLTDEL